MQSLNTNLMKFGMKSGRRNNFFFQYFVLFILIIFCVFQYSIQKIYGLAIYPDEFGYWASAADWIGYDWSELASLGSYYSFGYSVILCPILFFCKNGIEAYRTAVAVNMILQCVSILLLWSIFRRIAYWLNCDEGDKDTDKARERQSLIALAASVFYPVWTFYMQMTLTEALLTFMYVLICYLLMIFLEKPKLVSAMLLILALLYLYFVHMRTVGVAMAAVLTLFVYAWKTPSERKKLFLCMVLLIVGVGVGLEIKGVITDSVYGMADASSLSGNDYAGQIDKFKLFLSLDGAVQLLTSCIGKIYYMGMATFGFFYIAIGHLIKDAWKLVSCCINKRKDVGQMGKIQWMSLFLLLSVVGQLLISAIFMMNPGRLDGIVYGRYNDYMLPVFIGLGILILMRSTHPVKTLLANIGISTVSFVVSLWIALKSGQTLMQGYFAAGISYLADEKDYQIIPEFCKAYLFGFFLMIMMTGCVWVGHKTEKSIVTIAVILLIEVALTFCLTEKYIYPFNETNYEKLKIYEYIEEYQSEEIDKRETGEMKVCYLYNGGQTYIDLIQFMMQEESIHVIREKDALNQTQNWEELKELLPQEGFLIVDINSDYLEKIEKLYEKCVESNDFILFLGKDTE
ncbi:MAG: hypothetical protein J6B68_01500 [Lachnospiraceae bacterium]|nr:hypothetical protein [Lachnospiraceae bacterium]